MTRNPDECADVVDSAMKQSKVRGRGVTFNILWEKGVFVGINTRPSDRDMRAVCARIQKQVGGKVGAVELRGKYGFLFYSRPSPPALQLPSPTTPTPKKNYKQFLRQQSDNEARSDIKHRNKKR